MKKFVLLFIILLLNSCGGGSTAGGKTTWGIDQKSGIPVPVCNGDQNTTTNAITVQAESKISNIKNPTYIRIWHYESGVKKVCVIQGEAIINE